ncbi:hypothetical protein [Paenibacillus thermotolerans]|uniref:hypothetical protein n=1 Tax=Paenibacillus thermotolerans TaxID=3027807 RepID=UPI00236861AD|nr:MULTISPECIES: hypothetical protein [unclassified Paenibacillus]
MAASKAQKQRRKAEREGRMNPESLRAQWNGVNPVSRATPTKAEALRKQISKHKLKRNGCPYDDGSVFCFKAG